MKSKILKILAVLLTLCCMSVLILVVPPDRVVPFFYGNEIGAIEHKRIETTWILRKYEITGFPGETREWLTRYHGEAPGQQVFFSFLDWGLTNPDGFISITEGIDPAARERLVASLATGIIDNLDEQDFALAFGESDVPIIKEIREAIREQQKH